MKVYLYDIETGLYEGETFEDADFIQDAVGMTLLPPPVHEPGAVPVFDRSCNSWTLIAITTIRQLLKTPGMQP